MDARAPAFDAGIITRLDAIPIGIAVNVHADRFHDEGEAVQIANETPFGLAAGVWTTDAAKGFRVSGRIRAGTVWINTYRRVFPGAPFGGYRGSGIGRERGLEGLREYTQTKNIMIDVGE